MLKKIGHIKNPLTVIAIFAGLAEISGTVILPLLETGVQNTYVWFLMLFPTFLVAVFFFVLYKKHHVLYAPTDYRDDESFTRLFQSAPIGETLRKRGVELDDVGGDAVAGEIDVHNGPNPENGREARADPNDGVISAADTLKNSFRGNGLLAEELVTAKLTKEFRIVFDKNLAVKGHPKLVFDAVATLRDKAIVVETRFTRNGNVPEERLLPHFDRVQEFSSTLPVSLQEKVEFIFAIVTDATEPSKFAQVKRLVERTTAIAANYSFKTSVRLFQMGELEREFSVR
ncbi:hypothetical protein [Pararobbsia alpina]|uniref:Uncharacterized protein n=1 Tax=Pararobbsia alpina TaxID=621374 RepID=A0A6S7BMT4_9BURK|nr:hypothetical protein [Pararobbsia alpina]CAB3804380.1 hypothetical protein LMG28138_05505 [Pararobbsia alpina]